MAGDYCVFRFLRSSVDGSLTMSRHCVDLTYNCFEGTLVSRCKVNLAYSVVDLIPGFSCFVCFLNDFCLFRDASDADRAWRHFLVQDVSLPVCELLLVTFLHRIFQTQVSEYRETKIEDEGKTTWQFYATKLAIKLPWINITLKEF